MSIGKLHQRVMDTLTEEQLEEFIAKWQMRAQEAKEANDSKALATSERQVKLYEKRLERVRGKEEVSA